MRGRKVGDKYSMESRETMSRSSPWKVGVITPDGQFDSLTAAAKFYNCWTSKIDYRCTQGDLQRRGEVEVLGPNNDYRGWIKLTKSKRSTKARPVATPWGNFNSISDAARERGCSSMHIIHSIKIKREGFSYL